MPALKLIFFEDCPNAERARRLLKQVGVSFEQIRQDSLPADHPYRRYASPTVLNHELIVFGSALGDGGGGCSIDIPSVTDLKKRLETASGSSEPSRPKATLLSTFGSIGSAMTVGLCPICIPAIGAFLSTLGLGFLVQESVLQPLLFLFIGITLFGLFWSYLKEHKKIAPLLFGIAMSVGLYVGRYEYIGVTANAVIMWGSILGIIAVSFWNTRLKKQASCSACVNGGR